MSRLLQYLFFALVVKPLVLIAIGLNIRHRERLPRDGPAIVVANHNSHLDTLVLMSLLPMKQLRRLRPVAAADYFLKNRLLAWFATQIMNIIPMRRGGENKMKNPLSGCLEALKRGEILILFPEGSRGEPERLGEFKRGVGVLCKQLPNVPVYPVFLHGLGKSLPKGEAIFVPHFCDVFVGEPLSYANCQDSNMFVNSIASQINGLAKEVVLPLWT